MCVLKRYDVVIVTYELLALRATRRKGAGSKSSANQLLSIGAKHRELRAAVANTHWHRVVLDEVQIHR